MPGGVDLHGQPSFGEVRLNLMRALFSGSGVFRFHAQPSMAERMGFDPLNAESCTALHGLVRAQKTRHLPGFRFSPDLIDVF
jgi:hypothetical protein